MISNRQRAKVAAALVISGLLLGACGDNGDDEFGIVVSGSSTVEPITALVREDFIAIRGDVDVSVDGPGTGDGFKLFCAGQTDISDASRPIKQAEAADCAAAGIEFIELKVGIDGISVIAPEESPIECLSFADLYALIGPESEGFDDWGDAHALATELGSTAELPDANLVITAPSSESGTYDSFVEIVIEPTFKARVEAGKLSEDDVVAARADYAANPDDNAIIEGVTADRGGLGWVGFAFADQAEEIKLLSISAEPGGECVAPTIESIQDSSYPISRDLYIYVNKAKAEASPHLVDFVDFYLAGLEEFVLTSDYVPLADSAATVERWESRTVGAQA